VRVSVYDRFTVSGVFLLHDPVRPGLGQIGMGLDGWMGGVCIVGRGSCRGFSDVGCIMAFWEGDLAGGGQRKVGKEEWAPKGPRRCAWSISRDSSGWAGKGGLHTSLARSEMR